MVQNNNSNNNNNTNNTNDTGTPEDLMLRSCNNCHQLYNAAQFTNNCPLCGCEQYTVVTQNPEDLQPFKSILGYTVIPPDTKEHKEILYQYHCLNTACNSKFWSATDTTECVWCHSKDIEHTGEKKEI